MAQESWVNINEAPANGLTLFDPIGAHPSHKWDGNGMCDRCHYSVGHPAGQIECTGRID